MAGLTNKIITLSPACARVSSVMTGLTDPAITLRALNPQDELGGFRIIFDFLTKSIHSVIVSNCVYIWTLI